MVATPDMSISSRGEQSVGYSIADEAMDVARFKPQEAYNLANDIYLLL